MVITISENNKNISLSMIYLSNAEYYNSGNIILNTNDYNIHTYLFIFVQFIHYQDFY